MVMILLWPFIYSFVYPWVPFYLWMSVGLLVAALVGYLTPQGINFISGLISRLVYGPTGLINPNEYRFYQEDMERARGLIREEQWDEAIQVYRDIVRNDPFQCEPRFYLAQTYQRAGYFGPALNEYSKIVALKDRFGSSHPLVIESERAIKELKERIVQVRGRSTGAPKPIRE